jgi:hypothetical protein
VEDGSGRRGRVCIPTAAASDHPEFDCTAPRAKTALTVIAVAVFRIAHRSATRSPIEGTGARGANPRGQ